MTRKPDQNHNSEHAAGPDSIGATLSRLRLARGYSQLRLAELLCAAAGTPTVSRHEVSRWEREERVPGQFWLGWLATVLDAPPGELAAAAARRRRARLAPASAGQTRLWHPPTSAELRKLLDHERGQDLSALAHAWLAGPSRAGRVTGADPGDDHDGTDQLRAFRRMDDLLGGVDLLDQVDRGLRAAIGTLEQVGAGPARVRTLRLVAGWAQLAGWVRADAGHASAARRAYRVGLRAAAAAADRPLAGYVLAGLSHLSLTADQPDNALLLARTGYIGARRSCPPLAQVLLLHRVALAAAHAGERRVAHQALATADRINGRVGPDREPDWLYWLDEAELAAMTGRCLAALERPLRAVPLLAAGRASPGPRTTAVYAACLARAYLALGEVEQACEAAAAGLVATIAAGSVRAAGDLGRLQLSLRRHQDVPVVRGYLQLATAAGDYLPDGRDTPAQPTGTDR